jgi:hypothetical protein
LLAIVFKRPLLFPLGKGYDYCNTGSVTLRPQQTPEVIIGSQRFIAAHRVLDEEKAISVITGYERRHWLIARIIRRVLSYFLGKRYDGSKDHRRRLVAQLPLIAFYLQ